MNKVERKEAEGLSFAGRQYLDTYFRSLRFFERERSLETNEMMMLKLYSEFLRLTRENGELKEALAESRAPRSQGVGEELRKFVLAIFNLWDSDRLVFNWDDADEHGDVKAWMEKARDAALLSNGEGQSQGEQG